MFAFGQSNKDTSVVLQSDQQGSLLLGRHCISFKVRSNKRIKGGRLLISPDEGIVVESPYKTVRLSYAQKLIMQNKIWVQKTLKQIEQKRAKGRVVKKQDQSVLIFGHEKELELRLGQVKDFYFETRDRLILGLVAPTLMSGELDRRLVEWVRAKAKGYFSIRVPYLNRGRFEMKQVKVKNQKTLWGSCTQDKHIQLNWRLVMAPIFVSDYIVFHEMAHTVHLDHSKAFWRLVSEVCPAYKKAETWLEEFGFLLREGWE